MAGEADREIVRRVSAAISALNEQLAAAAKVGLYVEIDYITHEYIGEHYGSRLYSARIERRELLS